ncbi:hypothetical protein P8C59_005980 [Phyllachora maydis]|uniref:Uncharacterized protein n=1 Tax=Phyllachora maydis TaxID=1825666 RepID=A0AAD9MF17_9PEZI|nr:hypothetical protein P8C59_005980 [Phyllachora maydis]
MQLPTALILAFAALSASAPTKDAKQLGQMCSEEDVLCNEATRDSWLQNGRITPAHQETDGLTGSKMTADGRMSNGRMNNAMTGAQLSGSKDAHLLWHAPPQDIQNDMKAPRSLMSGHLAEDVNPREHAQQLDDDRMLGIRSHMESAIGEKQQQHQQQQQQWESGNTLHLGKSNINNKNNYNNIKGEDKAWLKNMAGLRMINTHQESTTDADIKTTRDLPMSPETQAIDAGVVRDSAFFSRHIADVAQLQTCDVVFGTAQTARNCMIVRSQTGNFIMTCQNAGLSARSDADKDTTSCIMYPAVQAQQQQQTQQQQLTAQQAAQQTKQQMPRSELHEQWLAQAAGQGNVDKMPLTKVWARGELCSSACDCTQFADHSLEQYQCATNAQCQALGCSFIQQ